MKFKNKKILIVGLGKSGQSVIEYLINKKCNLYVFDENKDIATKTENNFNVKSISLNDEQIIKNLDLCVLSPGVSIYSEIIKLCNLFGVKVVGELEFGLQLIKGRVLALTGSNGKTTTVSLLNHIFKEAHKKTILAGNIGNPLTSFASCVKRNYIIEVSSFQLESSNIQPKISGILNITPNHLDRHFSFREYIETKFKIFLNQTKKDFLVLNADDDVLSGISQEKVNPKIIWYSTKKEVFGACVLGENICYKTHNYLKTICSVKDVKLVGEHNLSNCLCAVCYAMLCNIKPLYIKRAICSFKPIEHRIEQVKCIRGIEFVNDSKSTTPKSTEISVNSFNSPIILILGGSDKGIDYHQMIQKIKNKVKLFVLTGEISLKLKQSFEDCKVFNYVVEEEFYNALSLAYKKAEKGDVVLLSPATASFDMFKNYEERGKAFKSFVNSLDD